MYFSSETFNEFKVAFSPIESLLSGVPITGKSKTQQKIDPLVKIKFFCSVNFLNGQQGGIICTLQRNNNLKIIIF